MASVLHWCSHRSAWHALAMDWKVFATTFTAVFVAELGDKTQLATMGLAAGTQSRFAVFLGASLALVLASALGVVAGAAVTRVIPPVWLARAAGALFIVLGALSIVRAGRG